MYSLLSWKVVLVLKNVLLEGDGIICRARIGARDLYHGVPDLQGAIVEGTAFINRETCTVLKLKRRDGQTYHIAVLPAEG